MDMFMVDFVGSGFVLVELRDELKKIAAINRSKNLNKDGTITTAALVEENKRYNESEYQKVVWSGHLVMGCSKRGSLWYLPRLV
jgi:hypothetical protein